MTTRLLTTIMALYSPLHVQAVLAPAYACNPPPSTQYSLTDYVT